MLPNPLCLGVRANISLEEERLDGPFRVDFFLWFPVKNLIALSLKQLKLGITAIRTLENLKIKPMSTVIRVTANPHLSSSLPSRRKKYVPRAGSKLY